MSKAARIIAIDYGMVRIGVAYSDASKTIASPLAVVAAEKQSGNTLKNLVKCLASHQEELGYSIEKIVVGMPLLMSGKSGLMADEVRHFMTLLEKAFPDAEVVAWDERLTSVQADRTMREANMSRKKRAKHVDTVSAVIILQNYLDHIPRH
jgi:putative Holliday junction resolvase